MLQHEWFTASVARVPDEPALVVDGQSLTYQELDAMSRSFAGVLGPRPRVGLLASRSVTAYVAYLATLRAGGVVVPMHAAYPAERNRIVAESAGLDVVVVDEGQEAPFADNALRLCTDGPAVEDFLADLDDLSYVLFTSGSTGRPKGVPIRHRNLRDFVRHNIDRYGVGPGCRLSQTFDLTFDPSVFDMFVAWGSGATLVVPSRDDLYDPVSFVNEHEITHWYSVPSIVSVTREAGTLEPDSMPSLRWSLFAGEQLTLAQAKAWSLAAPNSTVENLYGPTELTVTVTAYRLPADHADWPATANATVPIGEIYPHLEHRITDEGELQVRGSQRFDGYLDPADDEGRFAGDWYRTGDRVGIEDGQLVHLGRLDQQVKILGQRVELQEVEGALRKWAGLGDVVVLAFTGAAGDAQLAAIYSGELVEPAELRRRLRDHLPAHMIPKRYVHMERLPLNANGKIDRAGLL